MDTLKELQVVRALKRSPEVRVAADDAPSDVLGQLTGHFTVFDSWYRINSFWEGTFLERTVTGAFTKTMAERRAQIVTAFNHGSDPQIGDKSLGPLDDLREDATGGYYDISLLDTSYNRDLLPALKRGLYGASFRFQTIRDEWNDEPERSDHNPDGIPERTILEARLYELGPVTYPASPAATAGMRGQSSVSLTDEYYRSLEDRTPEAVETLRAKVLDLRTLRGLSAADGTDTTGRAARNTGAGPAETTRIGLSPRERRASLSPLKM